MLVDLKADPNCRNDDGELVAHVAGSAEVIYELRKLGADFTLKDNVGRPPILAAMYAEGAFEKVKLLLEVEARIDDRDDSMQTPLMHAAMAGNVDVVQFLLEQGADFRETDVEGRTAEKNCVLSLSRAKEPDANV